MFKKAKRLGTKPVKCIFRVEVQRVTFPKSMSEVTAASAVSVCFERGGKIASSQDTKVIVNMDGSKEAAVAATLSLVVTMYKEDTGKYQPKDGQLIVRQKKKSALGEGFKGLGVASISLDAIMNDYEPAEFSLPMTKSSAPGGLIYCTVIPKMVGGAEATFDDTMSMRSGFSADEQINAADFDAGSQDGAGGDEGLKSGDLKQAGAESASFQDTDGAKPSAGGGAGSAELEAEISRLRQLLHETSSNYESVCDENERQKVAIVSAANEARQSEERAEELSDQLTVVEAQLAAAKRHSNEVDEKLADSLGEVKRIYNEKALLEERLAASQKHTAELEGKLKELATLKDTVAKKDSELSSALSLVAEQTAAVEALQSSISEAAAREAALEADNGKLRSEAVRLGNRFEECAKEIGDLKAAIKEKDERTESSEDALKTMLAQLAASEEALKAKFTDQDQELAKLKEDLSGRDAFVLELTSEKVSLQEELSQLRSSSETDAAAIETAREALENEVRDLKEKLSNVDANIDERLSEKDSEIAGLRMTLGSAEEALSAAETKLEESTAALSTSRSGALHLKASITALEAEVGQRDAIVDSHQRRVTELEQTVGALTAQITEQADEVTKSRSEYALLTHSYQEQQDRLAEAEAGLVASRHEADTYKRLQEQLRAGLESESQSQAQLLEKVALLENQLLEARAASAAQKDTIGERDGLIAELRGDLASASRRHEEASSALGQEIADLKRQLAEGLAALAALQGDVAARDARIELLATQAEAAARAADQAAADLAARNAALQAQLSERSAEAQQLQADVADLQEAIAARDAIAQEAAPCAACEAAAGCIESLQEQLQSVTAQLAEQEQNAGAELSAAVASLREREAALAAVTAEAGARVEQHRAAEEALCRLQEENDGLAAALTGLKTILAGRDREISDLRADVDQLDEEARRAAERHREEAEALRSAARDAEAERDILKGRLESDGFERAIDKETIADLTEEVNVLTEASLVEERKIKTLQADVLEADKKYKMLKFFCSELEDKVVGLTESNRLLEAGKSEFKQKYLLAAEGLASTQLDSKRAGAKLKEELTRVQTELDAMTEKYMSSKEALMVAKVKQRNAEQSWQAASGTGEVPTLETMQSMLMEKDNRIESLTGELEDIISQLIEAKMASATYCYELDEWRKKSSQLKRRVQTLAERVAVLEVAAAEALEARDAAQAAVAVTSCQQEGAENDTSSSPAEEDAPATDK